MISFKTNHRISKRDPTSFFKHEHTNPVLKGFYRIYWNIRKSEFCTIFLLIFASEYAAQELEEEVNDFHATHDRKS